MPINAFDFVASASRGAVACSISDMRAFPELEGLGGLAVIAKVTDMCAVAGLVSFPSLEEGELETLRVFRSAVSGNDGDAWFDSSREAGEGFQVEFKQTLGLNVGRFEANPQTPADQLFDPKMIHEVIKTVVAFLNAEGGILIIGLCDNRDPYGIQNEYPFLPGDKTLDGWNLRLNAALDAHLMSYRVVAGFLRQHIVERDGSTYCVIKCEPRRDRITACKMPGNSDEIVYRRSGAASLKLQATEIEALVMDRYRERGT